MNESIAKQIAQLLNNQNQLTIVYDAERVLKAAHQYIYRLDENANVIGTVEVKRVQWYQCEIDHLSVSVKRQGIGQSLLTKALDRAKELGAEVAQCTIRVGNTESEGIFAKFGFVPASTFTNQRNGNQVKIYQKILNLKND